MRALPNTTLRRASGDPLDFDKVRPRRLYGIADAAAERVAGWISSGQLKEGDRLPSERQLCEVLGVSRTALREALSSLEALGIVESRSTRGRFVASTDSETRSEELIEAWLAHHAEQLVEINDVRVIVETHCVRTLRPSGSKRVARVIRRLLDEQNEAFQRSDPLAAAALDMEFHSALCGEVDNKVLLSLLAGLISRTRPETLAVYSLGLARRSLAEHSAIVEALERGETQVAGDLLAAHLTRTSRGFLHARRGT